jgi:hypothetical protein
MHHHKRLAELRRIPLFPLIPILPLGLLLANLALVFALFRKVGRLETSLPVT